MMQSSFRKKNIVRCAVIAGTLLTISSHQIIGTSYYGKIAETFGLRSKSKDGYTFTVKGHSFTITAEYQKLAIIAAIASLGLYGCYKLYQHKNQPKPKNNNILGKIFKKQG